MTGFLLKTVNTFILAILWLAALGLVLPFLESSRYALRLASQPAPERLRIPVANVKPAALHDSWHAPRPGGRRHEGIDIFSSRGTPVLAATEGIVLRRGHNRLGGKVVWVLGPGGQRHYYAHLDRFAHVSAGQRIQAGTVLGYVGNTGNARTTPPHLHYGIYGRKGAVNPFPKLVRVLRESEA